jgi:hypothetical protein
MAYLYTPLEQKWIDEMHEEAVVQAIQRPSESPEERERIWKLLVLSARSQ